VCHLITLVPIAQILWAASRPLDIACQMSKYITPTTKKACSSKIATHWDRPIGVPAGRCRAAESAHQGADSSSPTSSMTQCPDTGGFGCSCLAQEVCSVWLVCLGLKKIGFGGGLPARNHFRLLGNDSASCRFSLQPDDAIGALASSEPAVRNDGG
jgi:hypothetical protein